MKRKVGIYSDVSQGTSHCHNVKTKKKPLFNGGIMFTHRE